MALPRLLLVLFACLAALPAAAELVIELKDGQRVTVPVDPSEIARISFGRDGQASPAGGEGGPGAAGDRDAGPRLWRVGPGREHRYPSDVARVARDGDTVEIDAGVYPNDYATWRQDDLTLRGVGGMAHLKSKGLIPNRKAIWIINGDGVTIENVEFSGAAVRDTNGAGIRHQGGRLTLRNTFFHDNEFSILAGRLPKADIDIRDSRFWDQKRRKRHSHGVYIGDVRSLTFIGNHVTGTDRGHQVKSRASENLIAYNRIEDRADGNSSRLIDLSNCGFTIVVGNDMHQAATSENFSVIGYGPEGCKRRSEREMRLYVVNNTFVNEARGGELVNNHAGGDVVVRNNLVYGPGSMLRGSGEAGDNLRLPLGGLPTDRWAPPGDARAVDRAADLSAIEGGALVPKREFNSPAGTRARPVSGRLDIGARELAR